MLGTMSKRKRDHEKKRRASFKIRGEVGFFDRGDRDAKLSQLGEPLLRNSTPTSIGSSSAPISRRSTRTSARV
jgi:hypothetical protein